MDRFSVLLYLVVTFLACSTGNESSSFKYDTIIYNADIIDGTGNEAFRGYVAIRNDTLVRVSTETPDLSLAGTSVNARGKVLSPGFIDLHAHGNPFETPGFQNFSAMGVTTITLGQDGSSPETGTIDSIRLVFQGEGLGTNLVMFYGHGTLRSESGAGTDRQVSPYIIERMDSLLNEILQQTHGLSLGLEYTPGMYADRGELSHLARITGEHERMIMSHIRNEDDDSLKASLDEMLSLGDYCAVHISHLKSVYGQSADRAEEILSWLYEARENGIAVTADIYPYTASYTGIGILFPDWAKTSGQLSVALNDRPDELRKFLFDKVMSRNGPEATLIGTGKYAGMTLAEAAEQAGSTFVELLINELGPKGVSAAYFVMNDSLQSALLTDPLLGICSDGSPTGYHPRGHGTFARVIEEYVINRGSLTLEEAIRKMTGYPAQLLSLPDRGRIAEGMVADLIIFDPLEIHETAGYNDPLQTAVGFNYVMVNGSWIRYNGKFTGALHGHYILPSASESE